MMAQRASPRRANDGRRRSRRDTDRSRRTDGTKKTEMKKRSETRTRENERPNGSAGLDGFHMRFGLGAAGGFVQRASHGSGAGMSLDAAVGMTLVPFAAEIGLSGASLVGDSDHHMGMLSMDVWVFPSYSPRGDYYAFTGIGLGTIGSGDAEPDDGAAFRLGVGARWTAPDEHPLSWLLRPDSYGVRAGYSLSPFGADELGPAHVLLVQFEVQLGLGNPCERSDIC
ncbi:MAG: hypothetical protein ACOC9J_00470 [Persicimonas sp.]